MHILLDHMSATIVAGMVLLLAAATTGLGFESSVDATGYYAARVQAQAFGDMLKDDFSNFGLGVSGSDVLQSSTGNVIQFWKQTDASTGTLSTVSYTITPVDTVEVAGTATPTFAISRSVNGVAEGRGPANITSFAFELRNTDGDAVASEDDAYSIYISFSLLPFFNDDAPLNNIFWSRTFRINNS